MSFTPINRRQNSDKEQQSDKGSDREQQIYETHEKLNEEPITITSLKTEFVPSRRWKQGLPKDEFHYWDEPVTTTKLPKEYGPLYPPRKMDLSDAWAVKIVSSEISAAERVRLYPAVFSTKNLRTNYITKVKLGKRRAIRTICCDIKLSSACI